MELLWLKMTHLLEDPLMGGKAMADFVEAQWLIYNLPCFGGQ